MGYEEVGMDHFALPSDPLTLAKQDGSLHRNFMGYTTLQSKLLIGLGASSISDVYYAYGQNEKGVEEYQSNVLKGNWTIRKGHQLTDLDIQMRAIILNLICKKQAGVPTEIWEELKNTQLLNLKEMESDGLISIDSNTIKVTNQGIRFIRNICSQIDLRLAENKAKKVFFSKTI